MRTGCGQEAESFTWNESLIEERMIEAELGNMRLANRAVRMAITTKEIEAVRSAKKESACWRNRFLAFAPSEMLIRHNSNRIVIAFLT